MLARQLGARIIVVGITNQTDATELRAIASSALDVYHIDNFGDLNGLADMLVGAACITTREFYGYDTWNQLCSSPASNPSIVCMLPV